MNQICNTFLICPSTIRGKYIGYVGVFLAFGQGVGPLLGGALTEKISWRVSLVMLINVQRALIITYHSFQTRVLVVFLDNSSTGACGNLRSYVTTAVKESRG